MKYVIESAFENMSIQKIMQLGLDANGRITNWTDSIEDVEELNSDYINEHYGGLQDDAYKRGLEDAWEAARKIIRMPDGDILDLFPDCYASVCTAVQAILKYDAFEAIAKLKAYEDKHSDRIEVGDEVKWNSDVIVITRVYEDGGFNWCDGISQDGRAFHVLAENVRKTGKHYDIQSILEAMRK